MMDIPQSACLNSEGVNLRGSAVPHPIYLP